MNPVCEVCGVEINTRTEKHFQYVEGWSKSRAKGLNSMAEALWHDRFRHGTCLRPRDRDQLAMFD